MNYDRGFSTAAVVGIAMTLIGCGPHKVAMPPSQIEPIRRLAVQTFDGPGGAELARDFMQALKAGGWTIAGKNQNADAVLTGTMTDYKAGQRVLIFLGETNTLSGGKSITVSNPMVSANGSQVLPPGPNLSMNSPHLVTERAVVGVVLHLIAQPKGNAVWGDQFSYESLDLASARRTVVSALVESLNRASAHLQREIPPGGQS